MPRQKVILTNECSFCEGTGYAFSPVFAQYESLEELSCPACNGTGSMQVELFKITGKTEVQSYPIKEPCKKTSRSSGVKGLPGVVGVKGLPGVVRVKKNFQAL